MSNPEIDAESNELLDWPDLDGLNNSEKLRSRVDRVARWFHRQELPHGICTPGTYAPTEKLHRVALPDRLDGKTVLDVGAWDGFYSFECERRGAAKISSVDIWDPSINATSEGYALVHRVLGSRAVPIRCSVYELDPEIHGKHDIVLYLGVLYHLQNPYESILVLREMVNETLIIETASDVLFSRIPAMAFYESNELGADYSNWFAPNVRCLLAMCRSAGFRRVEVKYSTSLIRRVVRSVYQFIRFREPLIAGLSRGRVVVHAHV